MLATQKYFDLEEARCALVDCPKKAFIFGCEKKKADGSVGRVFYCFPNFQMFLKNRAKFPHCHEYLVSHANIRPEKRGRLVFDFDLPLDIPDDFRDQIEDGILAVIHEHYVDIDIDVLDFVWSHCKSDVKTSKHLTVKNMWFKDWHPMSHTFYYLFTKWWDANHTWIAGIDLIDFNVVKNNTTLRMVGSSKIGKNNKLELDEPDRYTLVDSLIRVYLDSDMETEQVITDMNLRPKTRRNLPDMKKRILSNPNSSWRNDDDWVPTWSKSVEINLDNSPFLQSAIDSVAPRSQRQHRSPNSDAAIADVSCRSPTNRGGKPIKKKPRDLSLEKVPPGCRSAAARILGHVPGSFAKWKLELLDESCVTCNKKSCKKRSQYIKFQMDKQNILSFYLTIHSLGCGFKAAGRLYYCPSEKSWIIN